VDHNIGQAVGPEASRSDPAEPVERFLHADATLSYLTLCVRLCYVPSIAELPDALVSEGRYWVSAAEAAQLAGVPTEHVYPGLQRLRRRGAMFSPARGLYVVVPPEYRSWRVLPGELFIDAMMRALGRRYYVSLLTAAAMHGAAHQAPQLFQVMVDRHVADRDIERVKLRFYANEYVEQMAVQERRVDTGRIRLATRETTLVDLVVHPDAAGGLSNIATVMVEIGDLDVAVLARLASVRSRAVARRLGWLLERFRGDLDLEALRNVALADGGYPSRLVRALPARGGIDPRWNLQINSSVESDL
jgi:predicted transcriptional regulator of viral defense system